MKQVLEKDKNQLYLDDYCYIDLSDYDIDISDRANEWIGDRLEDAAKHFFDKGANSYRNNVWQDASEKPKPNGELTKEFYQIKILVIHTDAVVIRKTYDYSNLVNVERWAYLEDLLPDTEEPEII